MRVKLEGRRVAGTDSGELSVGGERRLMETDDSERE